MIQGSNPVILIKGAKIADFAGWSLNISSETDVIFNPPCEWTNQLWEWYDKMDEEEISCFHHLSIGIGLNQEKKDDKRWGRWKKEQKQNNENNENNEPKPIEQNEEHADNEMP